MVSLANALSIDVEEHYHAHAMEHALPRETWEDIPSRVVPSTQRILRLLSTHDVKATFFILGWVADRAPQLVQEIAELGHEIATHGYAHQLIYRQTPEEFADDLARSIDAITRACGIRPKGYRAPSFSITKQSLWALEILEQQGLTYDSSIFPLSMHDRYGIGEAQRFANQVRPGLWEFPVSTVRLGKQNLPVAGGGYFRLYPTWLTRRAIRHLNGQGQPAVVYLHPWEFDPDQPRAAGLSRATRFRHYVNLRKTESRLATLIREFKFQPMDQVFGQYLNGAPSPQPQLTG